MRLIDADSLIDELEDLCKRICDSSDPEGLNCAICPLAIGVEKIENELTVYPCAHRAGGIWIQDKYTRRCSNCGNAYWMRSGNEWNYCPTCGSKNKWEE